MITVFDIETSFQMVDGKPDPSPKHPDNFMVSMGINEEYFFFKHNELPEVYTTGSHVMNNKRKVQKILDKTTLLVGHNIKFDLLWLWESGFKYNGRVYDTMIGEYILGRGIKKSLKLKDCCLRRGVSQKSDATEQYIKDGVSFEKIPFKIVDEYGKQDIIATKALFLSQMEDFKLPRNKNLLKTVKMMCKFCVILTTMENNGIHIDLEELDKVEKEFQLEYNVLRIEIDEKIYEKMGDTKINPSSPEQLSLLMYGTKVIDKKGWIEEFNIGIDKATRKPKKRPRMTRLQFKKALMMYLVPIYKTKAIQCGECRGKGYIQKIKVNGEPYKNMSKCPRCNAEGVVYNDTEERAGFKARAQFVSDTSEGGFRTDRFTLERVSAGDEELRNFVSKIIRYNALETYLSTFVDGIKKHTKQDSFLYPNFMQCITATGRLSSRDPNFQNQPRGGTFPIRKVINSRFPNGKIMEVDFAQLEFRTAVFLAQDKQGMEDIKNGVDVHQFTADTIGVSRQDAKSHTFKPLYGGMSGTENEKRYYTAFKEKYRDIADWHVKLQDEAVSTKIVSLPTGREYAFPRAERMPWGGSSYSTQIKNYPVQGFATADIVPLACINIQELVIKNNLKSVLINTVHDSVVADVHPDEEDMMIKIMQTGSLQVVDSLQETYGINFNIPLDTEVKVGYNWLDLKLVE